MPKRSRTLSTAPIDDGQSFPVPSLREPRYSQSLERGLAILACFTGERPVMGIADLADALGMSRSTTHRYVITLVQLRYLEQGASRKYRLGSRVTDLGMATLGALRLREHSHPLLVDLRQRTGFTADLGVLHDGELLYVDRARSFRRGQSRIDVSLSPGSRLPAYSTAMGKLLLADLSESELADLIGELKLTKRAPNTITGKKALREELERIHSTELAVENEELAPGLLAIAAPVRDATRGMVAAVNLEAHSSMISLDELVGLRPQLVTTANRISASLGYRD